MQRRARTYLTGVALAVMLSGGLTACTGSPDEGNGEDTKAGNSSSAPPPAEPGKYRTLPEPCGAVGIETLKKLLPGAEAAESTSGSTTSGKNAEAGPDSSPYKGEATVTYDTDRRVGCRWKSATSLATRHLAVDLERVVSYDPAVSDDKRAQLLYDERAGQAEIPTGEDSGSPSEDGNGDEGENGDANGDAKGGDKSEDAGSQDAENKGDDGSEKSDSGANGESDKDPDASQSPDEDLSPRTLDGIGDNAYIDDQLDTADSGVHRDITLVFRSANVIATIRYDQWLTDKRRTPDSAELQEKARSVAEELAGDFDDN
ncbi:hypothetical protein G4Z16_13095 [Streptomyces bathyalis]|uniref:DUF3558 domain-containing protein n=1 Tax=Streptomyces bathyalis TaxID=2710756 RepID=A0A7T1WS29_9ACTN|nr:hypothetical protein [Streptomyces bathyalis]QPP07164.1 hypothetical protein G4Z16_13095 [Streptomyces bathyalis]